jgi:hypothetical protein
VATAIGFDARFHERHPLFWPIARAARAFAGERDWPAVETYARVFGEHGSAPARFEEAPAPPRRRRGAVNRDALYDARIERGVVPTRPRCWHDFLNALVWATFPRAKRALHARQHRVLQARIEPQARTLPAARSREHDALALVDEGGAVVLEDGRASSLVLFGHAIYEGFVLGRPEATACGVRLRVGALPDAEAQVRMAEAALLELLAREDLEPERLLRVPVSGRFVASPLA